MALLSSFLNEVLSGSGDPGFSFGTRPMQECMARTWEGGHGRYGKRVSV